MKRLKNKGGVLLWIMLILIALGSWVGYKVGRLYFDHTTLSNEMTALGDETLLNPRATEEWVRNQIVLRVASYDVKLLPEDISLTFNSDRDRITIAFAYHRIANFIVTERSYPFEVHVQRVQAKPAGLMKDVRDKVEGANQKTDQKYQETLK